MRDLEKFPYNADELLVVNYLTSIQETIGAGDDPINFLISLYDTARYKLEEIEEMADMGDFAPGLHRKNPYEV